MSTETIESNIKIEKGVPKIKSKTARYPFKDMEVGDSFSVEIPEGKDVKNFRTGLHAQANTWAKYNNKKFGFSTAFEDDGKKVRIWRVK